MAAMETTPTQVTVRPPATDTPERMATETVMAMVPIMIIMMLWRAILWQCPLIPVANVSPSSLAFDY
jgi:hypothetical protein